jgi:hypothetical protein
MSTDRDVTRIVRSWLHEDAYEDADRILNLVLEEVDTTPQRSASWLARRFPVMNSNFVRFGAAAVVVLIAILGYSLLRGSGGFGAQPTPQPTPAPTPMALHIGPLEAGTYVAHPLPAPLDSISFSFTVPDGWQGVGPVGSAAFAVAPTEGTEGPSGAALSFIRVTGVYSDPCHGNAGSPPPVEDRVDDLARALGEQTAYDASAPTEVTLGGYSGLQMDLQLPSDIDFATCDDGAFWVWDSPPYAQGPGNRWHLWILDVDGTRVVILAEDFATTSAAHQSELQAIAESVEIQP